MKRLRVGVLYGGRSGEHEVSLASAAAVFANLDRKRYEPDRDPHREGRPLGAGRSSAVGGVGRRRHRSDAQRRRAPARRHAKSSCRRGPVTRRSCSSIAASARADDAEAAATAHRSGARRDLSRAARPVRRGRHDSGPARAGQRRLRRLRRAGLGRRHGQGRDEGAVSGARPAGRRTGWSCSARDWRAAPAERRRSHRATPALSAVREARQPRLERRHLEGARAAPSWPPRSSWPPSSIARSSSKRPCRTRARSKCARARQRRRPKRRCPARSCRHASSTTTRRSTSTAGSRTEIPARARRRRWRARCGARRIAAFDAIDGAGLARVDFLLSRIDRRALHQRDQHHARLHDDQHVLEDVGARAASTIRRSSID